MATHAPPQPNATYCSQAASVVLVPQQRAPKYKYTPNDYLTCTIITAILCGFFSPLSIMFTIPAFIFARKSRASYEMGDIKLARKQGMVAAYLNITAVFFALVICVIAVSGAAWGYGHTYLLQECLASVRSRGEDPALTTNFPFDPGHSQPRCFV